MEIREENNPVQNNNIGLQNCEAVFNGHAASVGMTSGRFRCYNPGLPLSLVGIGPLFLRGVGAASSAAAVSQFSLLGSFFPRLFDYLTSKMGQLCENVSPVEEICHPSELSGDTLKENWMYLAVGSLVFCASAYCVFSCAKSICKKLMIVSMIVAVLAIIIQVSGWQLSHWMKS